MERKNRENFPKRTGPLDLDSRSDFCFVAQSFQKEQGIGALLRCADAGMAREVIIVGRKCWRKKGAVGGTSCVPYRHIHSPRDAIAYLRSNGMSIVAIEKNDRSTNLFDCVYPPKPAFVFGDEVYGIHRDFFEAAELFLEIPMYETIRALNVAVAGAVVMYDYLQKRNREAQIKAEGRLMEEKNGETFPRWSGLHNFDSRSDFCFVAQSFQTEHNINTLLRYADAGMAREVVAVGRRGWDEKGAVDEMCRVPCRHIYHPCDAIDYLRENEMSIVAIEKNDRSTSLFDCGFATSNRRFAGFRLYPPRPAFVLGNEVYGVYPPFLEAADLVVEIPMYGTLGSLNVAVAGAVVMYDYLQKKH